jgi:hypothetical protein
VRSLAWRSGFSKPGKAQGERRMMNKDGKRVAQVSPYSTYIILEKVRGAKVGGLKEAGKGGTGRYIVGEGDVQVARDIIAIALTWKPEPIEASAAKPKAAKAKSSSPKRSGVKVTVDKSRVVKRTRPVPVTTR